MKEPVRRLVCDATRSERTADGACVGCGAFAVQIYADCAKCGTDLYYLTAPVAFAAVMLPDMTWPRSQWCALCPDGWLTPRLACMASATEARVYYRDLPAGTFLKTERGVVVRVPHMEGSIARVEMLPLDPLERRWSSGWSGSLRADRWLPCAPPSNAQPAPAPPTRRSSG